MDRKCTRTRSVLSAELDGEATDHEIVTANAHLSACSACQIWQSDAARVTRSVALRAPLPSAQRDYAALARRAGRTHKASVLPRGMLARTTLVSAGLVQIVTALFLLMADPSHIAREVVAFDVATGLGAIAIAIRPIRAEGMLPVLAVLTGALFLGSAIDLFEGSASLHSELPHLLIPVELALALRVRNVVRYGQTPDPSPGLTQNRDLRAA